MFRMLYRAYGGRSVTVDAATQTHSDGTPSNKLRHMARVIHSLLSARLKLHGAKEQYSKCQSLRLLPRRTLKCSDSESLDRLFSREAPLHQTLDRLLCAARTI